MKIEPIVTSGCARQKITGLPNSALILQALVDEREKAGYRLTRVTPASKNHRRCDVEFEKIGSETK